MTRPMRRGSHRGRQSLAAGRSRAQLPRDIGFLGHIRYQALQRAPVRLRFKVGGGGAASPGSS